MYPSTKLTKSILFFQSMQSHQTIPNFLPETKLLSPKDQILFAALSIKQGYGSS